MNKNKLFENHGWKKASVTVLFGVGLFAGAACMSSKSDDVSESDATAAPEIRQRAPKPEAEADRPASWSDASSTETEQKLQKLDRDAQRYSERAESSESWLEWRPVIETHLARARYSGSYAAYRAAGHALDRAFRAAPGEAGPHVLAARYHSTLHHLEVAESHLETLDENPLLGTTDRAAVIRMKGGIAQQRGELERAEQLFRESWELKPAAGTAARLGLLKFKTGNRQVAEEWVTKAQEVQPGISDATLAWLRLQRGVLELETGAYQKALEHFDRADSTFSGWYMIEEHRAETLALLGEHDRAIALYQSILEKAPLAEFKAALAGVYETVGRDERASALLREAREEFASRLERFPKATYGHALGFYLERGPSARALELARSNHELRPGPEAAVSLAQTQLEAGALDRARSTIEEVLEGSWETARMHATAWKIYAAAGESALAARERKRAEEIHPHIADAVDWLGGD